MNNIDVLLEPVHALLNQIGAFMPRLAIALGVLVAGWLIAKAFRYSIVKALRALNFNVLTERAGIDGFLQQSGTEKDTTDMVGWIVICDRDTCIPDYCLQQSRTVAGDGPARQVAAVHT